jgi:large subunit ribosomal protein L25
MATLEALIRQDKKKNKVKKLRAEGLIPAVIYGLNKESTVISVKRAELLKIYKSDFGINIIIELNITDGDKKSTVQVLTHDIETDCITNSVKHVDFIRVDENVKVKANIPLKLVGTAPGLKMGGVMVQKIDSLFIKCLPAKLLKVIEIDMSEQNVGDFVRVKDVNIGDIEILTAGDDTIVRIAAPRTQEEIAEEEASAEGEAGTEAAEGADGAAAPAESEEAKKD